MAKRRNVIHEAVSWAFKHYPVPTYPLMRKTPEQIHSLAAGLARKAAIKAFQAGWKARAAPPQNDASTP